MTNITRQFILFLSVVIVLIPEISVADIDSREYKLRLRSQLFTRSNELSQALELGYEIKRIAKQMDRSINGRLKLSKERFVRFYDTEGSCLLSDKHYFFRERIESGDREVTLKFRHPDRYIAENKKFSDTNTKDKQKFEEDISAPFISRYSNSKSQYISKNKNINKLDDVIALFPSLQSYSLDEHADIRIVGGFTAYERVYKGLTIDLGNLNANFTLTLWYENSKSVVPVIAEISFQYGHRKGKFRRQVVNRAYDLFEKMESWTKWTEVTNLSKTAYVYSLDPSFCP